MVRQANSNKTNWSSKSEEKTKVDYKEEKTSKETQSSSKESGEKDDLDSQKKEVSDEGGQSTPKDKIYAKGHGSVSYNSLTGKLKPASYEGYTEETVKEALGNLRQYNRDPKYLTGNLRDQEIKNLKYLDQYS